MQKNQTAILIFARAIREEIHEKMLFGSNQSKNIRLFEALNLKIKATANATGMPSFLISTHAQQGIDFRTRYQNAIQTIFDKGFENVIVVGNDSVAISKKILLEVNDQLRHHKLVFGATTRGGIYTMGISRATFESFDFDLIPWQSDQVASAFDCLLEHDSSIHKLDAIISELNTPKDLREFVAQLHSQSEDRQIYGSIFDIYFDLTIPAFRSIARLDEFFNSTAFLRGPPQISVYKS